jgi:hypothetical protein
MNKTDRLFEIFKNPPDEFSPYPFWFLNDTLDEHKLISQINDFYNKGIKGFVIHPRIGIPRETPYLSDNYMKYIKI